MTRIFTEGFEMGDDTFWDYKSGDTTNSRARTGIYSYHMGNSKKNFTALTEFYFRQGMYRAEMHDNTYICFRTSTVETLATVRFTNDYSGKIELRIGTSTVATSVAVYPYSTWDLMEIYLKIADTPNGIFTVKMNGIEAVTYTGDTKLSYTYVDNFDYFVNNSNWWLDDLAMNDTNGIVDNSWCGNGYIEKLTPNANGDVNQFTGNDGNQTDNYLLVDEAVPDGDTTYTSGSEAGQQDMYGVSDFSGAGKSIKRIWAEARVKDFSYSAKKVKIGYNTSGSIVLSGSAAIAGTWGLLKGEEALTNISASAAWTEADLDAIQFVIESQA